MIQPQGAEADAVLELYRLRRSAHRFLSRYGQYFWQTRQQYGEEPLVPPAIGGMPAGQRAKALARDEARRIAQTRLYGLDAAASEAAVELGAVIRTAGHHSAVAATGGADAVASMDITAPARCGFLRWSSGVGYSSEGAPLIACHWGRLPEGTWLVWWADNHATADIMSRKQRWTSQFRHDYLTFTGPLLYEHSLLLGDPRRRDPGPPPAAGPAAGYGDGEVDSEIAMVYTLLGTWALLTVPGLADLRRHEPSPAEARTDRRAGITPSPVTYAAGHALPEASSSILQGR